MFNLFFKITLLSQKYEQYICQTFQKYRQTINFCKMINHVVLFKVKDFASDEEKKQVLAQFKAQLLALKDVISELKYIEVGTHYLNPSPSFDLCLISHFDNADDLQKYQVHPAHLKVGEFVKQVTTARAAVDFEF